MVTWLLAVVIEEEWRRLEVRLRWQQEGEAERLGVLWPRSRRNGGPNFQANYHELLYEAIVAEKSRSHISTTDLPTGLDADGRDVRRCRSSGARWRTGCDSRVRRLSGKAAKGQGNKTKQHSAGRVEEVPELRTQTEEADTVGHRDILAAREGVGSVAGCGADDELQLGQEVGRGVETWLAATLHPSGLPRGCDARASSLRGGSR